MNMPSEINNFPADNFLQFAYILDSKYQITDIIDTFTDFLWVDRFNNYGEFELTMPMTIENFKKCQIGTYLKILESDKVMIIETMTIHTDPESGDTLVLSGRSLEVILERRIILDSYIGSYDSNGALAEVGVQDAIRMMITNNIISPSEPARKIEGFIFKASTNQSITSLTMTSFEDRGVNLFEKIQGICSDNDIGFRVSAVSDGGFQFELYPGVNRSRDQSSVDVVVFSEAFDNLANSNYIESVHDYKTAVYYEWEWKAKVMSTTPTGSQTNDYGARVLTEVDKAGESTGLSRREVHIKEGTPYDYGTWPSSASLAQVEARVLAVQKSVTNKANEYLSEYDISRLFDGEVEPFRQFVYGKDYGLGDIVQLENRYFNNCRCRVTEVTLSRNSSGPVLTPVFTRLD